MVKKMDEEDKIAVVLWKDPKEYVVILSNVEREIREIT